EATFGTDPADVLAGIGPAIGPCCYDVGQEVIDAWERTGVDPDGVAVIRGPGALRFDLWEANRRCLIGAGVPPDRVEVAEICTRCHADDYFSHRSRVQPEGRFAAVVSLDGGAIDG
ncbi:MAG TPA: laccase domain-containing protein, partial [Thermomicrobiaceae bacterium]|nr:laccase domain-containing protein [Thermomicrobiaceae bacterium]